MITVLWRRIIPEKIRKSFQLKKQLRQIIRLFLRPLNPLRLPIRLALEAIIRPLMLRRTGCSTIQLGQMSRKGRISIFIGALENRLRRNQFEMPEKTFFLAINPGNTPNEALAELYRRQICLLDDQRPVARFFSTILYRLLKWSRSSFAVYLDTPDYVSSNVQHWENAKPSLKWTDREKEKGEALKQEMGISGKDFVCFGLREAAYYQQFLNGNAGVLKLNPEAASSTYIRNPKLENYLKMTEYCVNEGLAVLRMGQVKSEPFNPPLGPLCVDYASRFRSDFGDIYLLGNCRFAVAGAAGLWWVAQAFNRPVVMTDTYVLFSRPFRNEDIYTPQLLWLKTEKRFLSFKEMLQAGMRYAYEENCIADGVEMIHNTADEIQATVEEMHLRLMNKWHETEEDQELQRRFNAVFPAGARGAGFHSRIGAKFLSTHQDLLEK